MCGTRSSDSDSVAGDTLQARPPHWTPPTERQRVRVSVSAGGTSIIRTPMGQKKPYFRCYTLGVGKVCPV